MLKGPEEVISGGFLRLSGRHLTLCQVAVFCLYFKWRFIMEVRVFGVLVILGVFLAFVLFLMHPSPKNKNK